jgi:hypothetical protein
MGPNASLLVHGVSPKTVLLESSGGFYTKADEIIKIAIWKSLDIQINRRTLNLQVWAADDLNLAIPDRESFEGMVIFFMASS